MKSRTSKAWLKEHFNDPYVKQSWKDGYRSRAAYKLIELQEKYRLIKSNDIVVDLGAAPGSWSQLITKWIGKNGRVIAMDLLEMDGLPNVDFIQGDFASDEAEVQLLQKINDRPVNVVVSDMAPNLSGNKSVDQPRMMYLLDLAIDFADKTVCKNGTLLMKVFQGEGFDPMVAELRKKYAKVVIRKPDASRPRSPEYYLLATLKRG